MKVRLTEVVPASVDDLDQAPELHRYIPGRPHWWQWLTVLSFDAPLVALAWQAALARAARVQLHSHHAFILGAAVWLAYAADRWVEGWRLDPARIRTQRHWFYQQYRWSIAAIWLGLLFTSVWLAFSRLDPAEWTAGVLLLLPVLAYLFSHQLIHRASRWRVPKEICVALLFAAGVVCFPAAARPALIIELAGPLLLFGLLCLANCALISLWENEVDRRHGQTSLALQFPTLHPLIRALPWVVGAMGLSSCFQFSPATVEVAACAAASGFLLGSVDVFHRRLGRQLARCLADVALMAPLVPMIVGRL